MKIRTTPEFEWVHVDDAPTDLDHELTLSKLTEPTSDEAEALGRLGQRLAKLAAKLVFVQHKPIWSELLSAPDGVGLEAPGEKPRDLLDWIVGRLLVTAGGCYALQGASAAGSDIVERIIWPEPDDIRPGDRMPQNIFERLHLQLERLEAGEPLDLPDLQAMKAMLRGGPG